MTPRIPMLALALGATFACGAEPESGRCVLYNDCPLGSYCLDGRCIDDGLAPMPAAEEAVTPPNTAPPPPALPQMTAEAVLIELTATMSGGFGLPEERAGPADVAWLLLDGGYVTLQFERTGADQQWTMTALGTNGADERALLPATVGETLSFSDGAALICSAGPAGTLDMPATAVEVTLLGETAETRSYSLNAVTIAPDGVLVSDASVEFDVPQPPAPSTDE